MIQTVDVNAAPRRTRVRQARAKTSGEVHFGRKYTGSGIFCPKPCAFESEVSTSDPTSAMRVLALSVCLLGAASAEYVPLLPPHRVCPSSTILP